MQGSLVWEAPLAELLDYSEKDFPARSSGRNCFHRTTARISKKRWLLPDSPDRAFEYIDSWLDSPVATVVHPSERHADHMRDLLLPLGTAGNLTDDAHLAALAIEHGAELCSSDNDFSRFEGVRWVNPLAR